MTDPDSPLQSLMPLLMRFSADSAAIRRLTASDEAFRGIVEDYLLAHKTLAALQRQVPARPERIQEYATLLRDLESEINKCLVASRRERS
jgi:hypothetical protein